jgi:hypothetical protein
MTTPTFKFPVGDLIVEKVMTYIRSIQAGTGINLVQSLIQVKTLRSWEVIATQNSISTAITVEGHTLRSLIMKAGLAT